MKTAVSALSKKRYRTAFRYFAKDKLLLTEMISVVKKIIGKECARIVKPSYKSVLRSSDISSFNHLKVVDEMEKECPVSLPVLNMMANCKTKKNTLKIGHCYSILMNSRNKNCNISQRVNSLLMFKGKIRIKVFMFCNKTINIENIHFFISILFF